MIGYLKGSIIDLIPGERMILLLSGAVGYRVMVNHDLLSKLKTAQEIQLFIHTAVREDDISLYGFERQEELGFFRQLLSISGVGPKIGMEILSVPLHLTQQAIVNGEGTLLTKIRGVGRKTAERIILELKGKLVPGSPSNAAPKISSLQEEALLALESLGYEKIHILRVLSSMPGNLNKTTDMVKYFLKTAT